MENTEFQSRRYVIYGTGADGKGCLEYMEKMGLGGQVVGFTRHYGPDNAATFAGRELIPLFSLKHRSDVDVIVTLGEFVTVADILYWLRFYGKIYMYSPVLRQGRVNYSREAIESFYADDAYTRSLVELLVSIRDGERMRIRPMESVAAFLPWERYWSYDDYNLHAYDALTVIDCGAFSGDSYLQLAARYGNKIKKYYAMEPDARNLEFLRATARNSNTGVPLEILPFGAGDQNAELRFASTGASSQFNDDCGDETVQSRRIDDLDLAVEGKLCIKMDIEGFELRALDGAAETLRKYSPELAICAYHKGDDLAEIPMRISAINPGYSCVLRDGFHATCYASTRRIETGAS
ncbi:FkbM family methyltransferase [Desulfovibrio sp. OttesenSCG-928-O18]|nr:FkbM family methyltransferase [Desulfovibrio sp. OttesenSCG-928-O18]